MDRGSGHPRGRHPDRSRRYSRSDPSANHTSHALDRPTEGAGDWGAGDLLAAQAPGATADDSLASAPGEIRSCAVVCSRCGCRHAPNVALWRCSCGGLLTLALPPFRGTSIDPRRRSPWRYPDVFPQPLDELTLGEGGTPLVWSRLFDRTFAAKLEFLQPTGCHKDRGAAVLMAALRRAGIRSAIEDSSGNAGASLAAYAALAGVELELFVPATTPRAKLRQAAVYGAKIDRSAVDREAAAERARQAVSADRPYASHVYSPFFLAGQATLAFEIWEDLGRRAPDVVVVPVGNGILLYGLYLGFGALKAGGQIDRLPRLVGVQAAVCAPLAIALADNLRHSVSPSLSRRTRAVGLCVARPPRGPAVLDAVRRTDGTILTVSERMIALGARMAAHSGWFVEPSAASAVAVLKRLGARVPPEACVVVVLTGSGLKG